MPISYHQYVILFFAVVPGSIINNNAVFRYCFILRVLPAPTSEVNRFTITGAVSIASTNTAAMPAVRSLRFAVPVMGCPLRSESSETSEASAESLPRRSYAVALNSSRDGFAGGFSVSCLFISSLRISCIVFSSLLPGLPPGLLLSVTVRLLSVDSVRLFP